MTDDRLLAAAFLEQCPAACLWTVDSEGIFREIYGDAASIFGRKASELKGQNAASIPDRSRAAAWKGRFARAFAGETLMLRERHGNSTWYVTLFPVRREDRIVYAGGHASEITPWSTAEQQLRQTVLSALNAQEFERKMTSQFLHDSVGQNLTALGLQLDLVRMDLETLAPEACERIAAVQTTLEAIMEEVREYSYELNPSTVERAGLRPALDRMTSRLKPRFHGSVRVNADPSLKLDPKVALAFYHIAQEAVDNSVQHAACSAIEIAVKSTRNGPVLEVKDNGRGFEPGDLMGSRRGLGMLSMEHYAAQAGLVLSIVSNRETGTVVRADSQETA